MASAPPTADSGAELELTRAGGRRTRASDKIVRDVREALLTGRLQPGDTLGAEGALARRYDVSRLTVRHAIKALEASGVVRVRTGFGGGVSVATADPARFADTLAAQLKLLGLNRLDALVAQVGLEWVAAELAAQRATESDLGEIAESLRIANAPGGSAASHLKANNDFHRLLAHGSHNLGIITSLTMIHEIVVTSRATLANLIGAEGGIGSHRAIFDAIGRRDAESAGELASAHARDILCHATAARAHTRRGVVARASSRRLTPGTAPFEPLRSLTSADEIVQRVVLRLLRDQLQPGDALGGAEELGEQFGVSHATVRDALRALEASGLVEIRAGNRGGARIARGDRSRPAFGLAVQFKLARLTERDIVELRAGLDWIAAETAAATSTGADRETTARSTGEQFHDAVANAAHNWAITIILDALREIRGPVSAVCTDGRDARRAHRQIYDAIVGGDGQAAGRLMRAHTLRTNRHWRD